MRLYRFTDINLLSDPDIPDDQFFIWAKNRADAQYKWFKATGLKLSDVAFTEIPLVDSSGIYSIDSNIQKYLGNG